jgi:hypothetical protein
MHKNEISPIRMIHTLNANKIKNSIYNFYFYFPSKLLFEMGFRSHLHDKK